VHDKFLLLCATICGLGFIYLGYFWMTALPLAAVTEHGAESAHQEMLDEAGLGKGSEHGAEHASEHTSEHASETPKTETTAPAAPATEGGEHSSSAEPAKDDVTGGEPQASTTSAEPAKTETAPAPSTGAGEGGH
jgi:cytoskeletal protein RodZ